MVCWCVIKLFYALTSIAKTTPYDLQYRFSADVDWCIRIMKKSEQEHRALRNVNAVVAKLLGRWTNYCKSQSIIKGAFQSDVSSLWLYHYYLYAPLVRY